MHGPSHQLCAQAHLNRAKSVAFPLLDLSHLARISGPSNPVRSDLPCREKLTEKSGPQLGGREEAKPAERAKL